MHARAAGAYRRYTKERWKIERSFKWIKQNLKLKTFLGTLESGVS